MGRRCCWPLVGLAFLTITHRGTFLVRQVDAAVANDPRLRPTLRSRRLRDRVAAFQNAKKASGSQLKDTVAEFEAVLDDILDRMPPSPGFGRRRNASSRSGAAATATATGASRTGSLARSETVGGGMVDLELQRQRSVLIKEDEAALEWRAHLRTQVDLIRRLWRRFRDHHLVRFPAFASGTFVFHQSLRALRGVFASNAPPCPAPPRPANTCLWLLRSHRFPFHYPCPCPVQSKSSHRCQRRR